jgi:regulator of protease activity HflC (stomatin/prohibitin superfamily)
MQAPTGPVPRRAYAEPAGEHASLGKALRAILWIVPVGLAVLVAALAGPFPFVPGVFVALALSAILWGILVSGVRVAAQWEHGVVLRLGKFLKVRGPGLMYIIPFIDFVRFVDLRILALNIPSQKVITKDNVPAEIDGVLFFLVANAEKAVIGIQDYRFAIAQYAQASLRDVVGGLTLDELLAERQQIQERVGATLEERIKDWGVHVDSIRLLDIEMPEDLKRMMSRQASAEREKRATITKAEGDKIAAVNLAAAAATMLQSPGAMQLRTLQTIDGLGPSPSNTVVIFPAELMGGINYLNGINGPYEHLGIEYIPLGGLNEKNMQDYLNLKRVAAVGGSWIAKRDLLGAKDWDAIFRNAEAARRIVKRVRANE